MVSTPQNKRYRTKNDPFNHIEEPDIRPDFLARKQLSNAEETATKPEQGKSRRRDKNSTPKSNVSETLRNQELNQNRTFRNSVRGKTLPVNTQKSTKRRKTLKKAGPIGLISAIIFGGGFFFLAAQSMLGPHLSALYTQATDLQFTSYNMRNVRLMSYMIDGGNQVKISNFTKKYTLFTPYMKKRLAKNGIEVGHLDKNGDFISGQTIVGNKTVLKYNDKIVDANSFQNEFASNANFREAYYNAKRGRVAGFFDRSSEAYYNKKGATRDIFNKYKSTGNEEADMQNFKETVSNRVTGSDGTINTVHTEKDPDTGEETTYRNGEDIDLNSVDGSTPEVKARAMVNSIAGKVSTAGPAVCTALRIANITAIAVSSYQIYQSIAYYLSFMEPISKTIAGEGDAAAINETLNFITQSTDSSIEFVDDNGATETRTLSGSMLESSGAKLILGNTKSSASDVQPFSFDNITKAATRIAISIGATTTVCSGVMAASAIISLSSLAVPGGKLATFVIGAVSRTLGGIAMTGVVAAIVSAIVPYATKIFASNVFESYTGIPAGELFSQGAAAANFSLATQSSAYMPSSEESVKTQNRHTTLALAQEAEVDRLHRSPFDASNPNTFLGSIFSKFSYLSYSNSLVSMTTNIAKTTASSLTALSPIAAAADQNLSYTSQYSECNNLNQTVCDMYGYSIVSSDYSTVDIPPDDPTYMSVIEPNLDENGEIKDDSELAKFINFCVNRESPWGVTDANILNALQTDGGIVVNNLPVVNDVIGFVNAAEDVENKAWATGENCINSSDNPRWDSEFKYYQLYVEDMRILQSMADPSESTENPVITYQERYDAAHPIDNSFKGTLSRISGLSTDDVAFLLEYIDYSNQLANYDPSNCYKFSETKAETQVSIHITPSYTPSSDINLAYINPIFIDRRNYTV